MDCLIEVWESVGSKIFTAGRDGKVSSLRKVVHDLVENFGG